MSIGFSNILLESLYFIDMGWQNKLYLYKRGVLMSNRIKELREQEGLRQKDLATLLNVTQATLSSWECGRYEPDQKALKILSKKFNVSIDYLLGMSNTGTNVYSAQNIQNSNLVQGNSNIMSDCASTQNSLSVDENELVRIYRLLNAKQRHKLMSFAFDMEEQATLQTKDD